MSTWVGYEHNSAAGKTTGADCLPLLLTGVQEEGQDTGSGKMWLKMKTHYKVENCTVCFFFQAIQHDIALKLN